jgi:hypothetical protein
MKNEKVITATNEIIDAALNLTQDRLLCVRIGIYMNSERTKQLLDAIEVISDFNGLSQYQKSSLIERMNELDEQNVGVYTELVARYHSTNEIETKTLI